MPAGEPTTPPAPFVPPGAPGGVPGVPGVPDVPVVPIVRKPRKKTEDPGPLDPVPRDAPGPWDAPVEGPPVRVPGSGIGRPVAIQPPMRGDPRRREPSEPAFSGAADSIIALATAGVGPAARGAAQAARGVLGRARVAGRLLQVAGGAGAAASRMAAASTPSGAPPTPLQGPTRKALGAPSASRESRERRQGERS